MLRIAIVTLLTLAAWGAWTKPAIAEEITLTPDNTLVLRGEVRFNNMVQLSHKLLTSKAETVYLFIDSPGGEIFSGLQLVHAIQATNKKVVCIANTAISMAFIIFQACDERVIVEHSVLMQHMPSYGSQGQEPNNYSYSEFIHSMAQGLYKMQAEKMGMSVKDFYSKIRDDWWMFDDQGIENKAADRKVSVTCSPELLAKYDVETFQVFIFTVKLKFNGCPLIMGPVEEDSKAVPDDKRKSTAFATEYSRILETYNARAEAERWLKIKKNVDMSD